MRSLLFKLSPALLPLVALAQQQAPSQHSPSQVEYQELSAERPSPQNADASKSQVKLRWEPLSDSLRYEIRISRKPDFSQLVHSAGTIEHDYTTPALPPGLYYYQVQGYRYERPSGKHDVRNFVIGKPLTLSPAKQRMQAPQIIGPRHLEMFPTFGRVRLAWQPIAGARGYRFRIWNEENSNDSLAQRKTPRWITEIKQPWLEVHDAPYTSFMYLESGTYRWDVAAIDKDGAFVGDPAMGYFQMSRQYHLQPNELFIRLWGLIAPSVGYESTSGPANQSYADDESSSLAFRGEAEYFFRRHWGLSLGGSLSALSSLDGMGSSIDYFSGNLDALYRTYLSIQPQGWTMTFLLGIGLHEFPNIDGPSMQIEKIHVERPRVLGPRAGFRLSRRWNNPWEVQLAGNIMVNAFWFHDPYGGGTELSPTINTAAEIKTFYHLSKTFAGGLGLGIENRSIKYDAGPRHVESSVSLKSWNLSLNAQFRH